MFNIFVSNDDGINAEGIRALVKSLSAYARVYVAAPMVQQSAKSMSLSVWDDMPARRVELEGAEWAWEFGGTPCDCVKFGLSKCAEDGVEVDYVIGGVNLGANMGTDVLYSGTVACATEGALRGYKSIALSLFNHESLDFGYICGIVPQLLKLSDEVGAGTVLSVNAPDCPSSEVKGIKIAPLGAQSFDVIVLKRGDGDVYYYEGKPVDFTGCGDDVDLAWITKKYAVVTPLKADRTDHRALNRLRELRQL